MHHNKNLNYSYWENKTWFGNWDLLVAGGGIVGLSTAIAFRKKNPKAKIIVLERGILPSGASTKNAGFACFGSPGELLDDLSAISHDSVWETVRLRWLGLKMLRQRIGDIALGYKEFGGYELFYDKEQYEKTRASLHLLNKKMQEVTGQKNCFKVAGSQKKLFPGLEGAFVNRFEGQLDTGQMMLSLSQLAVKKGITMLNGVTIGNITDHPTNAIAHTSAGEFKARKIVVATNGFAKELLDIEGVRPARAQVLVTSVIPGLKIKGTYHFDKGYFYFRNIDGRVLLGGGRNLDLHTEYTDKQALNAFIQNGLEDLLNTKLIPGQHYTIERRWTGIMGVGPEKKPVIRFVGKNIIAAVRMGGMGVAIGSWVGEQAAELASK